MNVMLCTDFFFSLSFYHKMVLSSIQTDFGKENTNFNVFPFENCQYCVNKSTRPLTNFIQLTEAQTARVQYNLLSHKIWKLPKKESRLRKTFLTEKTYPYLCGSYTDSSLNQTCTSEKNTTFRCTILTSLRP